MDSSCRDLSTLGPQRFSRPPNAVVRSTLRCKLRCRAEASEEVALEVRDSRIWAAKKAEGTPGVSQKFQLDGGKLQGNLRNCCVINHWILRFCPKSSYVPVLISQTHELLCCILQLLVPYLGDAVVVLIGLAVLTPAAEVRSDTLGRILSQCLASWK